MPENTTRDVWRVADAARCIVTKCLPHENKMLKDACRWNFAKMDTPRMTVKAYRFAKLSAKLQPRDYMQKNGDMC